MHTIRAEQRCFTKKTSAVVLLYLSGIGMSPPTLYDVYGSDSFDFWTQPSVFSASVYPVTLHAFVSEVRAPRTSKLADCLPFSKSIKSRLKLLLEKCGLTTKWGSCYMEHVMCLLPQ